MHFASRSCIGNCRDRRALPGAAPPTLASTLVPALLRSPPSRRPALHGIVADRSCAADRARRGRGPGGIRLAGRQSVSHGKNTAVLQRTFLVSHAPAPPGVPPVLTARHRPAASGILPIQAPGRCRSSAAPAKPLIRRGFHPPSPVHRQSLVRPPGRPWVPHRNAAPLRGCQACAGRTFSCSFNDRGRQESAGSSVCSGDAHSISHPCRRRTAPVHAGPRATHESMLPGCPWCYDVLR